MLTFLYIILFQFLLNFAEKLIGLKINFLSLKIKIITILIGTNRGSALDRTLVTTQRSDRSVINIFDNLTKSKFKRING